MEAIPCSSELLLPEEFEQCKDYTELAYSVDFQTSDGGFTIENYGVYPEWAGLDWVWTTERGFLNHSSPAWFAPNPRDQGSCYGDDNQAGLMTMTSPVISVSLADGHVFGVKVRFRIFYLLASALLASALLVCFACLHARLLS